MGPRHQEGKKKIVFSWKFFFVKARMKEMSDRCLYLSFNLLEDAVGFVEKGYFE